MLSSQPCPGCRSVSQQRSHHRVEPGCRSRRRGSEERGDAALSSPSEWKGPTTGPKPIAGKRVAIIPCGLITEGCNRPARAATEAAKTIGWVPTVLDGQADTGKQLAAINAAVDGKYDAIIMILIDPIQVNEGVQRAIAANIPVVTLGQPLYSDERKALSQIPDISHDWLKTGELIGDYMIGSPTAKSMRSCSTIPRRPSFSTGSSLAPTASSPTRRLVPTAR